MGVSSMAFPGALDDPFHSVQFQVAHPQHDLGGHCGAAQERSNPGREFRKRERLGQVVVGAQVQPLHPVFHAVATGQNENGHSRLGFADMLQHFQPIHSRQGQIEDCHVIFKLAHHELRFIAVLRNVHGVLLGFQSLLYETGHRFVVFCYEDSHLLTFSEGQMRFGPASIDGERRKPG